MSERSERSLEEDENIQITICLVKNASRFARRSIDTKKDVKVFWEKLMSDIETAENR